MNCPACTRLLTEITVEDIALDVCHGGCGGIWFDNFELAKFDEPHESSAWEQTHISLDPAVVVDYQAKRKCPRCSVTLMRQFCSAQRRAKVDVCPQCAGNWLDTGELAQVRAEFRAKASREAAKVKPALNKSLQWFAGKR